jgi:protein-L-isoaspartate(D-aspartate) O-methyltransferase
MVRVQVESRGIRHPAVLRALKKVPRHLFVPEEYRSFAYGDHPLPIGFNQTISQPYIVALMSALLDPGSGSRMLEIGTGSGYQAAVLAEIAGEVYTVELIPELHQRASALLKKTGYESVHCRRGDGYIGWPEFAPYDGILVSCAPGIVPPRLKEQLKIGGRMCIPVGPSGGSQRLLLITRTGRDEFRSRTVTLVRFVPMVPEKDKGPSDS